MKQPAFLKFSFIIEGGNINVSQCTMSLKYIDNKIFELTKEYVLNTIERLKQPTIFPIKE